MSKILVEAKELCKYFHVGHGQTLKAVDHVNLHIFEGETLGVVGESGCGKTTCGRTVLDMYNATSGQILYDGKDIQKMSKVEHKEFRRRAQYIFQDPYASLDPRMTIGDILAEGMDVYCKYSKQEREDKIEYYLNMVGLNKEHKLRYPHELSGGQRQRVGIARCLAVEPKFIVCDEPISALDVSIQAQVVNQLKRFQRELGLTYLFISHDLSMVKYISDRLMVMYLGQVVETAPSHAVYEDPLHPYTQALMSAIPVPDPKLGRTMKKLKLEGEVPSPINPPEGCRFAGRCPYAQACCREKTPPLVEVRPHHQVACHFVTPENPHQLRETEAWKSRHA